MQPFSLSVRVIIFSIVWVLTMGNIISGFLPNLTEDCGVIESFKPFIKHDVYDSTKELKEKAKQKRQEKEEEENESEIENDKNNDFEMINGQDENGGDNDENLDEENEDYDENNEEENESDEADTKKDK